MSALYEELISQALQLTPAERLAMLEELAVSLKQELSASQDVVNDVEDWTTEEIAELTKIEPTSPSDIAAQGLLGTWSSLNISDGADWVNEQKRQRRERSKWSVH